MDIEKLNKLWTMVENQCTKDDLSALLQIYDLTIEDWYKLEEIFDKLMIEDWKNNDGKYNTKNM